MAARRHSGSGFQPLGPNDRRQDASSTLLSPSAARPPVPLGPKLELGTKAETTLNLKL